MVLVTGLKISTIVDLSLGTTQYCCKSIAPERPLRIRQKKIDDKKLTRYFIRIQYDFGVSSFIITDA